MNPKNLERNINLILMSIQIILNKGGSNNFVIYELGEDYYIQLSASPGDTEIFCEAVSNKNLSEGLKLSELQQSTLLELRWHKPNQHHDNYCIRHLVNSEHNRNALAQLIVITADRVYNYTEFNSNSIRVNLE